jgi:alpha-mannosidase
MVCHTHWDREWYAPVETFRVRLVAMMDELLDLGAPMLLDQTSMIEDYLAVRPEREPDFAAAGQRGDLEVGPWQVQPDQFLTTGEGLVQNLLLGRRWTERLGAGLDVGYLADCFGHCAQMPQLLRGFGIARAVVWRGTPELPCSTFRWRAPDGSDVLAEHLPRSGYTQAPVTRRSLARLGEHFEQVRAELDARALTETGPRLWLMGGDHHHAVPGLAEQVEALGDERVRLSALGRYFDELERTAEQVPLTELTGDLRAGYRWARNLSGGIYSSRMPLKQAQARAETLLARYAGPLCALGPASFGSVLLARAWRHVVVNQHHDTICGCCMDPIYEEAMLRLEKAGQIGEALVEHALDHSLGPRAVRLEDNQLAVFNPAAHRRSAVATCTLGFGLVDDFLIPRPPPDEERRAFDATARLRITDAGGRQVENEIVSRRQGIEACPRPGESPGRLWSELCEVRLLLEDLPPLGLSTLRVERVTGDDGVEPGPPPGLELEGRTVSNPFLSVSVGGDGTVSLIHRETGRTLGPLGLFEDGGDIGDLYTYCPPPTDRMVRGLQGVAITPLHGALEAGFRIQGTLVLPRAAADRRQARSSETTDVPVRCDVLLTPLCRYVELRSAIENTARDHRLRALFESGVAGSVIKADSVFAVTERPSLEYEPADYPDELPSNVVAMQRFALVEDGELGCCLMSEGLPEVELAADGSGRLALTLLRCVATLDRGDLSTRPEGYAGLEWDTPRAQCLGPHRFRYAILPFRAGCDRAWITEQVEAFQLPPLCRPRRAEDPRPVELAGISVEPADVTLSTVQPTVDGAAVLRIYNPGPLPRRVRLTWHRDAPGSVERTRLDGAVLESVAHDGKGFELEIGPFRVETFVCRSQDR